MNNVIVWFKNQDIFWIYSYIFLNPNGYIICRAYKFSFTDSWRILFNAKISSESAFLISNMSPLLWLILSDYAKAKYIHTRLLRKWVFSNIFKTCSDQHRHTEHKHEELSGIFYYLCFSQVFDLFRS